MKRGIYSDYKVLDLGSMKLAFLAGQVARDENGAVAENDIEEQAKFIFESRKKTLNEIGMIFLKYLK